MRLSGKNIIITGSAQGIGLAIAERLISEGANVGIADKNFAAAQATATKLSSSGANALALEVDVTQREQLQAIIQQFVGKFGSLDCFFNNAGLNIPMPFLEVTESNWDLIMKVNSLGVLLGTQEAAKQMIAQGNGGKIINTASIAGREGYADFAPYSASKFAVVALIQAGARALASHGITVNGFSPGVVATPLWDQLDKDLMNMGASSREGEALEAFSQNILLGRPASPKDIAGTAFFLASSDSDYMTGQIVAIDGGMVLV